MDAEAILFRINSGKRLTMGELEEVAALLEWIVTDKQVSAKVSIDDVYTMLVILARAKDEKYRHLLERYLEVEDVLTVSFVLEALCVDWGYPDAYLERVVDFALGVSWDKDEDVRQQALKILGEYLATRAGAGSLGSGRRDREVLRLLLNTFQDEHAIHPTRQTAYFSLLRARGKDWADIPSEYSTLDFGDESKEIDRASLQYCIERSHSSEDESEPSPPASASSNRSSRLRLSPGTR